MRCAWDELIAILPHRFRNQTDQLGKNSLQEIRLRLDKPPLLITEKENFTLPAVVDRSDISFVINAASKYSPWAATTVCQGYITAQGGHRIGICGEIVLKDGHCAGMRTSTSLCIRVARDFPSVADNLKGVNGNILILGPPGSGKTTLLRDLIRQKSDRRKGAVCVVDERGELFPTGFETGLNTDVLTGCPKVQGVQMALRTMGPAVIAVDEITATADCDALLETAWCGVEVIATAHASDLNDLNGRKVYKPLKESGLFETVVVMRNDKSWYMERLWV